MVIVVVVVVMMVLVDLLADVQHTKLSSGDFRIQSRAPAHTRHNAKPQRTQQSSNNNEYVAVYITRPLRTHMRLAHGLVRLTESVRRAEAAAERQRAVILGANEPPARVGRATGRLPRRSN